MIVRNFKISIRHDPNISLLNGYYTYRGQLCIIDNVGVKHYARGYVGPWEYCLKWATETVNRMIQELCE